MKREGEGEQRWSDSFSKPKARGGECLCSPSTSHFDYFRAHLDYLLQFRDILARKYPNDHIPSADGFASVKMHVHLFRYFNGRPGAAELRKRLNTVRTLAEIETVVRKVVN